MADKLKQFSVTLSYDVQKTFIVEAKDEDEAYQLAYNNEGEPAAKLPSAELLITKLDQEATLSQAKAQQ